MCTTHGRFSRDGDFNRRRGLYIKAVQLEPQDAQSIKFSKTGRYLVKTRWGDGNNFRGGASESEREVPTGISPERIMDGCCHYHFKTSFKAGRKCRRRRRLGRSSKGLNQRSCHDYPARRVIDRMRQGSIVGSVGPLHGPGRQRSHASAGQPGRTEGEDQLGPTTSHLGQCRRRKFRRTNQKCSTNSLCLRKRHHRLLRNVLRRHGPR